MTVNSLGNQELSYLAGLSATQGYQVLNKTIPQAVTNFEKTPQAQNDIAYFEKTVPTLKSVNDFIGNPKLVDFVLSAFGLDDEAKYQGLVKQVLTQDPNAQGSLVNQLSDPRFKQLATALDFYDDGLGRINAVGLADPKGANSVEGTALSNDLSGKPPAANATTPVGVGIGVSGSGSQTQFLVLQKSDGTTAYAKSAYFTVNSNNQLALPDGTTLQPSFTLPADTTAVTVTSAGAIYAQEKGQAKPTSIGQLETATFASPANLAKAKNGYYTPTATSGAANVSFATGKSYIFGATLQDLTNKYVQTEFEVAVGSNNTAVREALYFQRTIGPDEAAAATEKESIKDDVILGDSVLADVVETALSQPKQIAYEQLSSQEQIIDKGIDIKQLQNKSYVAQFTARYLTLYDASNSSATNTANSAALQILSAFGGGSSSSSSSSSGSGSILSLFS